MALSQFNTPASLQEGGSSVVLGGTVTLSPGELAPDGLIEFCVFVVQFDQDGKPAAVARGTGEGSGTEWHALATAGDAPLKRGKAVAAASLVVTTRAPLGFATSTWFQEIQLV